ncbi:MAG: GIY-YIG nuclease family protein [Pseudomonadota bacterium]|nr:GIY-YIG nuclease family protein [Pseudomonadota bacterium]
MISGIYKIIFPSGNFYIGSAVHFKRRWNHHLCNLKLGRHHNKPLQNAFNKYGEIGLKFEILLVCEKKDLIFYEQRAIDILKPEYNVCKTAGVGNFGNIGSASMREKLRLANLGKKASVEAKAKMRAAKLGKKISHSSWLKLKETMNSPAVRLKMATRSEPVQCVETGQIFKSGKAAGDWCIKQGLTTNKEPRNIINKAAKNKKVAYGYRWIKMEHYKVP